MHPLLQLLTDILGYPLSGIMGETELWKSVGCLMFNQYAARWAASRARR